MSANGIDIRPASTNRRPSRALLLIVGIGGVLLSALVYWALLVRQQQLVEVQFELDAKQRLHAIRDALADRLDVVRTLDAFYAGSQTVERREFHTFSKPLLAEYPSVTLLGWVPQVADSERDAHEQAVRDEGYETYRITEWDAQRQLVTATERDQYLPVCFLEPRDRVEQSGEESTPLYGISLGLDLGACPPYDAIFRRARETNRPVAATVGKRVAPDGQPLGWLVVSPVSRPKPPSKSETSGEPVIQAPVTEGPVTEGPVTEGPVIEGPVIEGPVIEGFVFSLFQLGPIVENALAGFASDRIDLYLFDPSLPADDCLLFLHASSDCWHVRTWPPKSDAGVWSKEGFEVADQRWLLGAALTDCYSAQLSSRQPIAAWIVGLLVTTLAITYVVRAARRAERVEGIVAQRTAELRHGEQLLRELIDLQERERKLIAYDIHDGLAQQLTGALMQLQAFAPSQAADSDKVQSTCTELKAALSECLSEARRLIRGLRPPVLDELGIVAAVEFLIDEHRQQGGPEIELAAAVRTDRFAPPLESAVFRIIQESLTNAVRYSQSKKVHVELTETDSRLHVEIEDWGIGFDPGGALGNRFGLKGIRERAKLLGGTVVIDSTPGKGTRVAVDLPRLMRAPAERSATDS